MLDPTRAGALRGGMTRRSPPQDKIDDRAFPIRVKFVVPPDGLWRIGDRLREWLARELASGDYAWHGGGRSACGDAAALYFRSIADAHRFVNAFPEFELADATVLAGYTSPARPFGGR